MHVRPLYTSTSTSTSTPLSPSHPVTQHQGPQLTPTSNSAGSNSGNANQIGSGNTAGSGNSATLPSILKSRGLGDTLSTTLGSVTSPSAGSGNRFLGNGIGNGAGSGNGCA